MNTTAVPTSLDLDALCVNTIRTLAMDAVQQANSGHPGTPVAIAPVAYALWRHDLRFDPADPIKDGISSRVVSMPSWEVFDRQSAEYRDAVLPPTVTARVAVEQGRHLAGNGMLAQLAALSA